MKNLKNYIKDYLNESVWDIEDNIDSDNNEFKTYEIKKFIQKNYKKTDLQHLKFVFDEKKDKYIVSCVQRVDFSLRSTAKKLTNDLFEWGEIYGDFDCPRCDKLESLEGAPKWVGGAFTCCGCPKLKSLKGAPEVVGGWFTCAECGELKNLEGAPRKVNGDFFCSRCPKLESLEGAPKTVGECFFCRDCPKLKDLMGVGTVYKDLYCTGCPGLNPHSRGTYVVSGEIYFN